MTDFPPELVRAINRFERTLNKQNVEDLWDHAEDMLVELRRFREKLKKHAAE